MTYPAKVAPWSLRTPTVVAFVRSPRQRCTCRCSAEGGASLQFLTGLDWSLAPYL